MSAVPIPKAAESLKNLRSLRDIPVVRQLGVFAVATAAVTLGIAVFFWTQKPAYVPVFAGTDPKSQSEAADMLRQASIEARLDPSGALSVPEDKVAQARLALASAGLPAKSDAGFEMLSGDQGFGTSQFVENARYQHALETELARTISALSTVREARVHLAIPKPSAFTRDRQPASASVALTLKSGGVMQESQVAAIVHLVASSIPNLSPERVTVVDQSGRLLSDNDPNSDETRNAQEAEKKRKLELEYVQRIQELLEPMTGAGRVNPKVSVDMNFDQLEEARETFGDPPRVRSEQISEVGNVAGAAGPQGVPGSATNTPDPVPTTTQPGAQGPADNSSRSQVRNYELDRTLTHKRQSPGRITRVTAAVLVDHIPGPAGKDGKPTLRALTPAEMKNVEQLVQQSIGFDAARGDAISVVNQRFVPKEVIAPEPAPFWENPLMLQILRIAIGGLIILAIVWVLFRPAINQLLGRKATQEPEYADVRVVSPAQEVAQLEAPAEIGLFNPNSGELPAPSLEDEIDFARRFSKTDSRRVAHILRNMIGEGNA